MSARLKLTPAHFLADVRAIEIEAESVLAQCAHYRRNGPGDELRGIWAARHAKTLALAAQRWERRYHASESERSRV